MTTTYKARRHQIDQRCEILAGLRMTSDRSTGRWGFHQSGQLEERQYKVEWGPSERHPEGATKWAADLDIDDEDGKIQIPHDAMVYFEGKDAQLMINIFCDMPRGGDFYAGVGFAKRPDLYGFDRVVPQDERGWWTYSRPIFLDKPGNFTFLYLMTLKGTGGPNVELTVHKITISRGKEHYTLVQKIEFRSRVFDLNQLPAKSLGDTNLRDLPIGKLVEAYKAWK